MTVLLEAIVQDGCTSILKNELLNFSTVFIFRYINVFLQKQEDYGFLKTFRKSSQNCLF